MGGNIKTVIRVCILCLAAIPAFAAQVVDPASARRAVTEPGVVAIEAELAVLATEKRTSELALRLRSIASNPALEPAAREWLLDRGLHELAPLAPTAAARNVVIDLSRRQPEVYTRVDPDHGDRATPLYDTGATARFVLRTWQRSEARTVAGRDLKAGREAAIDRFTSQKSIGGSDPVREGIVAAYASAPDAQLIAQRNAVVTAMTAGRRVDELALVIARRLEDSELAALVLDYAEASVALAAVRAVSQSFDPQTALELLARASRRADIASAAMLQVGLLARDDSAARTLLFDTIADPELGPSAAAALASIGAPAVAREVGRLLRASRSDEPRRMYVLALKLDGGAAARQELQHFLDARQGGEQLRMEVQQWLGH